MEFIMGSLGDEIFEWRKQMVEKLLLNGVKPEDLEERLTRAEDLVFRDCSIALRVGCFVKHIPELIAILDDFAAKNSCKVSVIECE